MRIAIAGLAHPHVGVVFEELRHWEDVELVAISDPDPALIAQYAMGREVPAYADHRALLDAHEVDVVAVASVYSRRAEVVVDALEAGAHVIVDKPLCTGLDQLARVEATAAKTGGEVSALFEKRFLPVTLAARELVAAGDLGRIVHVAATAPHKLNRPNRPGWFFDRATYGGLLGDLATHDIDLALLFTGMTSGQVSGRTGNATLPDIPGFHDHGAVSLSAADGVSASVEVSWLSPAAAPLYGDARMRLSGTLGSAEIHFTGRKVEVLTDASGPVTLRPEGGGRGAADAIGAFLAGRTPEVDTAATLAATRLALLAQASADGDGETIAWAC